MGRRSCVRRTERLSDWLQVSGETSNRPRRATSRIWLACVGVNCAVSENPPYYMQPLRIWLSCVGWDFQIWEGARVFGAPRGCPTGYRSPARPVTGRGVQPPGFGLHVLG